MMRVAAAFLWLTLLPSEALAQAKIALLIGNQAYDPSIGVLKNPYNDIALVGDALKGSGFEVMPLVRDARRSTILGEVRELVRRLNAAGPGAVGFMYYSGHGAAEADTGVNYLIPVNAREPGSAAFWDESLKLDDVLKLLEGAQAAAKFVVFDACRNELRVPTKSTSKGFVPVAEQHGMFIAYASAAGRTASDEGARGGPYATALARELARPGLDHVSFFQNVKESVFTRTGGAQQPWESNGLFRRVYLTGEARPGRDVPLDGIDRDQAATFIRETEDQARLEEFIRQFGDTPFGPMARARLEELRKLPKTTPPTSARLESDGAADCEQSEDYDRRIRGCTEFLRRNPQHSRAYNYRGNAFAKKEDAGRAIADYTMAIQNDPKYATAYLNRAIAFARTGEYAKAIADYGKAIEFDPSRAAAYRGRATALLRSNRKNEAMADFRKALSIDPSDQRSKDGLRSLGVTR